MTSVAPDITAPSPRAGGSAEPTVAGRSTLRRASRFLLYAVLTFAAVAVVLPIVWVALSSLKPPRELFLRPPTIIPQTVRLENYSEGLTNFDFLLYLRNTVFVVIVSTILTVIINSMAAFAFAKYRFRGKSVLFLVCLGTIMIPLEIVIVPVYLVAASIGLVDSLWGLIIAPAATPTGLFLLRQYMLGIPDELLEAARLDGASDWQIYARVVLPLTAPALVVLTIFSVIWRWNDFLWPLIIVHREEIMTLQLALARFQGELVVSWNLVLAMTVLSILPVLVVFLFMQRQLVAGIASTGVKG